ncbi:MAG: DUF2807 domain-containing protein [Bacteroides sp.]|nr:DUF2807 domain-containing protein [Roseburia sp.]MCM1346840.1 DUF2807 domain-containing protein [Bacteroides sp.]MCM1420634.1 DUF2807 domain-containing protein [Bacteroides sp.]
MMKAKSLITATIMAVAIAGLQSCTDFNPTNLSSRKKGFIDSKKWGKVVSKELDLQGFNAIHTYSNVDIIYTQDKEYKVCIEGNENALTYYQISVDDGVLTDRIAKNTTGNIPSVRLRVTAPTLHEINVNGAGDIDIKKKSKFDTLSINIQGAGDIDINHIECDRLTVDISGAGDIKAQNIQCNSATVSISGAGDADFRNLTSTGNIECHCSGAGDIDALVKCPTLQIVSNGAGDMDIEAECDFISAEASGTGHIEINGCTQELKRDERGLSKIDTKGLRVDRFIK